MATAKDIRIAPISSAAANKVVKRIHYSGKHTQNSQLHFGVFLDDRLEGALQFGPPIDRRKVIGLVQGTEWHQMLELNRMAFSDSLPRNSESRALAICFRLIRRQYPQIKWVLSYADATQCGDGTIYRASGFVLTQISKNKTMLRLPDGSIVADKTLNDHPVQNAGWWKKRGAEPLAGFQLRYIKFLDEAYRERLTCQELEFSEIDRVGASMYRGKKRVTLG